MNWKDIIKYIPLQPHDSAVRAARKKLWQDQLEAPDSKVIDNERAAEIDVAGNCCEQARNQVMELISNTQRRYEEEGRPDRVKDAEGWVKQVDEMDCQQLLHIVKTHWEKSNQIPPKGMKLNPEYLEWRRIYEEWKECDKDVV